MSTSETAKFQVGDDVMAARHFTDEFGQRHVAGQHVGRVERVEDDDYVLVAFSGYGASGTIMVREPSRWLEVEW